MLNENSFSRFSISVLVLPHELFQMNPVRCGERCCRGDKTGRSAEFIGDAQVSLPVIYEPVCIVWYRYLKPCTAARFTGFADADAGEIENFTAKG